jgi:hypothetical protein
MTAHGTGRARRIVALPAAGGARPAGAIGISGWEPTWQTVPGVRWTP